MNAKVIFDRFGGVLKRRSPEILCVAASLGVIGTAVSAVKATKKAEEKKKEEKPIWPCYIPTVLIGGGTIACVFSANVLNRKRQADLLSAFTLLQTSFNDYKSAVIDIYGEDANDRVIDHIVKERVDPEVHLTAPSLTGSTTLDIFDSSVPEVVRTFYDIHSNRYFESTLSKVIQAEYHVNRNFALGGDVEVDDFYEFLGLEPLHTDCAIGWDMDEGFYWIDFNHHVTELDDGMEIVTIEMIFEPGPMGV